MINIFFCSKVVQADQSDPVCNLVKHLSLYQGFGNSSFPTLEIVDSVLEQLKKAKYVLQSMEAEGLGTSEN